MVERFDEGDQFGGPTLKQHQPPGMTWTAWARWKMRATWNVTVRRPYYNAIRPIRRWLIEREARRR